MIKLQYLIAIVENERHIKRKTFQWFELINSGL